jgi:hypothetical protein
MPESNCTHHWVIDTPSGGDTCHGRCKKCGAERPFRTADGPPLKWADKSISHRTPLSARKRGQIAAEDSSSDD